MSAGTELDALNTTLYLFLRELSEPQDNSLRVVVQEAVVNPGGVIRRHPEIPELEKLSEGKSPIESTASSRTFELTWDRYVAYLVTEECVGACGQDVDEIYTGNLFRVYTKSHFLDHLARDTGGHTDPVLHFKLICQNHLIDVGAYSHPKLKQTGPESDTPTRIQ